MERAKIMFLLLLVAVRMQAQQEYFILIQAENNQPFYVRAADRAYSSSPGGHILLGHLKDSTYNFFIGFPRNQFPEQHFIIHVQKKDLGLILKNMGQQEWALFNWQTAALIKPVNNNNARQDSYEGMIRRNDGFATLMAGVVNDSAVLYTAVIKTAPADHAIDTALAKKIVEDVLPGDPRNKPADTASQAKLVKGVTRRPPPSSSKAEDTASKTGDTATGIAGAGKIRQPPLRDTVAKAGDSSATLSIVRNNVTPNDSITGDTLPAKRTSSLAKGSDTLQWRYGSTAIKTSTIKLEEKDGDAGRELVFVDKNVTGKADTIRILIAVSKEPRQAVAEKLPENNKSAVQPSFVDSNKKKEDTTKVAEGTALPDPPVVAGKTDTGTGAPAGNPADSKSVVLINSDCRNFATDHDVDKLRIKILSERKLDDQLGAARKIFRTRCFSAHQIKALSELFYNDESRFGFFETAYPFVSDAENFKPLVRLLVDPAYVRRFKEMVRMQ